MVFLYKKKHFGERRLKKPHPESFVLGEEEYIKEVSFHHGDDTWGHHSLFAVKFITNQGRSSFSYGNDKKRGLVFSSLKAQPEHQITGLVRDGSCSYGIEGRGVFCPTITDIVQMPLDADLDELFNYVYKDM